MLFCSASLGEPRVKNGTPSNVDSRCKGNSEQRIGKTGENPGMVADESQKQERGDR